MTLFTWYDSMQTGITATAGTVVLAALPIIVGTQLLFAFFGQDTRNIPNDPLQLRDNGLSQKLANNS